MLLSSIFTRSLVFAHIHKAQLLFILFRDLFLTIRQNSLYVTVCMIVRTFYQGYFIHSLSTLHYCNAPSLTTRLTGDYRDRTYTGKCGPASLDTLYIKCRGVHSTKQCVRHLLPRQLYHLNFSLSGSCCASTAPLRLHCAVPSIYGSVISSFVK